jgi:hypothetical protein
MRDNESKITRGKLLGWLGILSAFAFVGAAFKPFRNKKAKTVKMLTEDGRLVEVDASLLAGKRKRISDKELQNWVKPR